MSRCPAAQWRPIHANHNSGGCTPRIAVLHIMQGSLDGTDSWFRNSAAQASAHFGTGRDGRLYQWVDTRDTAWHNAAGNTYSLGIENEGYAGAGLTAPQLAAVAKVIAWAREVHGIPLQVTDTPAGQGLGWHGMGGTAWGGHTGCPGDPVVAQRAAILTMAAQDPAHPPTAVTGDDDMYQLVFRDGHASVAFRDGCTHLRLWANNAVTGRANLDQHPTVSFSLNASHIDLDITGAKGGVIRLDSGDGDIAAAAW